MPLPTAKSLPRGNFQTVASQLVRSGNRFSETRLVCLWEREWKQQQVWHEQMDGNETHWETLNRTMELAVRPLYYLLHQRKYLYMRRSAYIYPSVFCALFVLFAICLVWSSSDWNQESNLWLIYYSTFQTFEESNSCILFFYFSKRSKLLHDYFKSISFTHPIHTFASYLDFTYI